MHSGYQSSQRYRFLSRCLLVRLEPKPPTSPIQGTDCVMLSGVIAAGDQSETAVKIMSRLGKEAEDSIVRSCAEENKKSRSETGIPHREDSRSRRFEDRSHVKCEGDHRRNQEWTHDGACGEVQAERSYFVLVNPVCPESAAHVASRALVYSGIIPLMGAGASSSTEEMINFGVEVAKKKEICFGVAFDE